ncbi:MAG: type IV toxin-antitoxin system AbiEi family antitoxin domain-containing protein [Phycisphaerae bacterium]|nr:type IV toxin-antitoxin system AbiEi family antitoxin domain-containing protein [Phycisphaerae bacterium]
MDKPTLSDQVLQLARRKGVLRPKDLDRKGIPRVYLGRLCARGLLQRMDRGIYIPTGADVTEHHSLAEVCKRIPHARICLLSALRYHNIGTQLPREVWIALPPKARRPKTQYPPLRIVRFSGKALTEGVEMKTIEGVKVPVYSPAKTIADCFKYRLKIGLDVFLEAVKDGWHDRKFTMDQLSHYAGICRVSTVIRPYLEAIVWR